ncbi:MAG: hypothetical protein SFY32_06655 [Bacteroidota bacterium]|nr:hypothetical protein [Bacteroidota bacterium]
MNLTHLALVLIFSLIFTSCNKFDKQEAKPCAGQKRRSADFFMFHTGDNSDTTGINPYDSDTINSLGNYDVRFQAKDNCENYKWRIGAGIYTISGFKLDFRGYLNTTHKIVLETYNKRGTECFPNDTGTQVVVRNLVLTNRSLLFGRFKGRFSYNPSVEVILGIDTLRSIMFDRFQNEFFIYLANYPFVGDTVYVENPSSGQFFTYKKWFINWDADCKFSGIRCFPGSTKIPITQECAEFQKKRGLNYPQIQATLEFNPMNNTLIFQGKHIVVDGQTEYDIRKNNGKYNDFKFEGIKILN